MAANSNNPAAASLQQQNKTNFPAHRRTHSGGGISNAISNLCKNFSFNSSESENLHNGIADNNIAPATTIRKCKSNTTLDNDFEAAAPAATTTRKSTCDCTNISIMHLFHEMKQEFPTIPDEIVTKHVNENCHQRDICFKLLKYELALHPSPVQTYPAKVLQQLQQVLPKKPLKPVRKAPVPTVAINTACLNSISYKALKKSQEETDEAVEQEHEQTDKPRTRPTTLNLFAPPQQQQYQMVQVQLKQHIQQRKQHTEQQKNPTQQLNKPLRRAPLPPVPPKPTHLKTPTNSTETDVPVISPTALSKSSTTALPVSCNNSNISKTNGNKSADPSPIRHRAVLNMQPQVPSVRSFISTSPTSPLNANGQKSFTSVNLTLRQPGSADTAAQSTIDIAAGPGVSGVGGNGLTYSSTSYNAQQGYQKTFNITVSDEGSEISATRIRSPNTANAYLLEDQTHAPYSPMQSRQRNPQLYAYNSADDNRGK